MVKIVEKIELGKAYMDGYNVVVCVYAHDPNAYSPDSDFRNHSYTAICLSQTTNHISFYSTFNTKGQYDRVPGIRDVVREATLEELEYALSRHKLRLTEPDADTIVSKFYEAWKKHNL